jgi:hypothetical protein
MMAAQRGPWTSTCFACHQLLVHGMSSIHRFWIAVGHIMRLVHRPEKLSVGMLHRRYLRKGPKTV